jgi:hypothetical protein
MMSGKNGDGKSGDGKWRMARADNKRGDIVPVISRNSLDFALGLIVTKVLYICIVYEILYEITTNENLTRV